MDHRRTRLRSTQVLLLALCLQAVALAEQPWPRHAAEAAFISQRASALPEALRAALIKLDEFSQGKNTLPDSLKVALIDLNGNRGNRYQPVRVADYQEAEPGGPLKFVRERSPAQFRR